MDGSDATVLAEPQELREMGQMTFQRHTTLQTHLAQVYM